LNADKLAVSKLYADELDVTRFADDHIDFEGESDRPVAATALLAAHNIGFLQLGAGYRSDWHPAPRKQYVMVLEGTLEVEAGDASRRLFRSGSILLVTDVEGRGHRTNVIGNERVLLVWVPIP
jgi:hypothetical protein